MFTATRYVQPVKHVVDRMLLKLAVLLFVFVRPGASYFNLFLSQAEVRKLMGKQKYSIRLRLYSRFYYERFFEYILSIYILCEFTIRYEKFVW